MVHLGSNLVGMNPNPFLDTSKTLPGPFYPIFDQQILYWGPFGSHLGSLAAIPFGGPIGTLARPNLKITTRQTWQPTRQRQAGKQVGSGDNGGGHDPKIPLRRDKSFFKIVRRKKSPRTLLEIPSMELFRMMAE